MKSHTLPIAGINLRRWAEVLGILSRYELTDLLSHLKLADGARFVPPGFVESESDLTHEQRIKLALTEIGTTAIKLGQVLSTRPDLVGETLARELEQLQFNAPPTPAAEIHKLIEGELSRPVHEIFSEFDDIPIASASIGQVHRARLESGELVAVKVQHPNIEARIRVDLAILLRMARLAEHVPEFARYRPYTVASEFQRTLMRELDSLAELRNLERFASDLAENPNLHIPKPYRMLSSRHVLTMEYLEGIPLTNKQALIEANLDLNQIARNGAEIYLDMILVHGRYHADPHPGNVLVLPDQRIGLLDFGMIGRIDEVSRDQLERLYLAIVHRDVEDTTDVVIQMCETPPDLDRARLTLDIEEFLTTYAEQDLRHFDLSSAVSDFTRMVRRYDLRMPSRVALMLKVIVMLEGSSRKLSPEFNLFELIDEYRPHVMARHFSPRRHARRLRQISHNVEHLLDVLPRTLGHVVESLDRGSFDIHLQHRRLEPSVNRIVLATMASALFLGSSLLLAVHLPPLVAGVSLPGALGGAVAIALGLRVFLAIRNSGSLDGKQ